MLIPGEGAIVAVGAVGESFGSSVLAEPTTPIAATAPIATTPNVFFVVIVITSRFALCGRDRRWWFDAGSTD
jgi:hypothetical protein